MKKRTRIAFWNVRTLSDDSRLAQVETEMLKYKLHILGLSEVRRNGFGELRTSKGLTFIYSGKENEDDTREHGVGFLLSDTAKRSLLDWKPISDRIITARFNSKARKVTIVQCYAPTNVANEEDKDVFYSTVQNTLKNIRKQDIIIVMGDLNAKVGNDNTGCEKHLGKYGLGTRNDNGERFLELCQNYNLAIGGSYFLHKDIHKYTWTSPDGVTRNQIDHLAISCGWRTSLLDIRNKRGADIDSDHMLMVAELRLKVATARPRSSDGKVGRRYNVGKLEEPDTRRTFALELQNRFSALEIEENTIDAEWNRIKVVYQETSSDVLGFKLKKREADWISQATWKLIEERKLLHLKILETDNVTEIADLKRQYKQKRRSIYRSTRKDRRKWADDIADCAQSAANTGNLRALYEATRTLSGKRGFKKKPLRDRQGILITTSEERLRRWREHFEDVFRIPTATPTQTPNNSTPPRLLDIPTSPPTRTEVACAILSLKSGKAPGLDLITAEMLKADTLTAVETLTPLLEKIWTAEELPEDWNKGLLITVPKKGDLSQCSNWRGITLLSIPSKVLCKVILGRLTKAVEPLLRREQAGFRPNRSCTDQINTLRIIVEEASEWQREVYLTFVDFEKAFDTVCWSRIWSRLDELGVPSKIRDILKAIYRKYSCKVEHDGLISEDIAVHSGVRQGCLLSPLLFLIVLDGIMHRTNDGKRRGIEWGLTEQLDSLDYADDLCLLSHKHADMQAKLEDLQREALLEGLKINPRKTQEMRTEGRYSIPLLLGSEPIERVQKFTYLGSVVSETGGTEEDIASRIAKARATFAQLRPIWQSRKLTRRVKLKIFRSNVKSVLLYGCETWRVTKDITQRIQVFINRCLRQILRIFWPDKISNEQLWDICHETPIGHQIKRRKWKWIGHTLRRAPNHIPRQALEWTPQGKRKRGRPKHTWKRSVAAELKAIGLTWSEAKRVAQDRTRWRSTVDALCPTQGS